MPARRTPFFYLHGDLSGGGFYSLKLSRALGPDQPFYVLPPQDIRLLPAAPSIEEMAAAHLAALRAVRPKGPYVIGGFCIGGLVAYELAQQIEASGDTVEMLLVIDAAPEDKVLRALRWLAGAFGALLRWDDHAKVDHFGRWVLWRGRLRRWYGLNVQAQVARCLPPHFQSIRARLRDVAPPFSTRGPAIGHPGGIKRPRPARTRYAIGVSLGVRPLPSASLIADRSHCCSPTMSCAAAGTCRLNGRSSRRRSRCIP